MEKIKNGSRSVHARITIHTNSTDHNTLKKILANYFELTKDIH